MTAALLFAGWAMLAQVQTPPAGAPPPAPASTPSYPSEPQPQSYQSDTQAEEPQTSSEPDVTGQGAYAQQAWAARLHNAYADAEARQGPLDGNWRLTGEDGDVVFEFVLSDPGYSSLTGAWRDLRRGGGADGSGFVSAVYRTADGLVVRLTEPGQGAEIVLQLRPTADGRWGGELTENGAVRSVVMTRF